MRFVLRLVLLSFALLLTACGKEPFYQEQAYVFGTQVDVSIYGENETKARQAVAEPVVYMVDHFVVGGFYRVHTSRGIDENLNAPGAQFVPLAFETSCTLPNPERAPDDVPNRFYAYGVIARLAMLAAAIEIEEMLE